MYILHQRSKDAEQISTPVEAYACPDLRSIVFYIPLEFAFDFHAEHEIEDEKGDKEKINIIRVAWQPTWKGMQKMAHAHPLT